MPQTESKSKLFLLELLEESIKHWEDIVAEPLKTSYKRNACALCRAFHTGISCSGCCISIHTGRNGCVNTPYTAFAAYRQGIEYRLEKKFLTKEKLLERLPKLKKLAQAELDFLISLRTTV